MTYYLEHDDKQLVIEGGREVLIVPYDDITYQDAHEIKAWAQWIIDVLNTYADAHRIVRRAAHSGAGGPGDARLRHDAQDVLGMIPPATPEPRLERAREAALREEAEEDETVQAQLAEMEEG